MEIQNERGKNRKVECWKSRIIRKTKLGKRDWKINGRECKER
jgi:hypothetical protein